jgi:hypothetical protein
MGILLARHAPAAEDGAVDVLSFGDPASEQAHALKAELSECIPGGLNESARRILPSTPPDWQGGRVSFHLKVHPERPNYFTIRLWGSDLTQNRLMLYCEGQQIGYRHLGDVDILDWGTDEPGYNGRFYYHTTPLPLELTKGKAELACEIRATGRIWGYGTNFAQYQKPMDAPTRGLYRVYTHTDGFFTPPAGEKQGAAPADPPVRKAPGEEVLGRVKERIVREIGDRLKQANPLNQMQMQFLAKAWHVKWTTAHRNPAVIEKIVQGLDAVFLAYCRNPKLAESEPSTWNPDWYGLGPSGQVIHLLGEPLAARLDEEIPDGAGGKLTRRAACSRMLAACRDWHQRHRRLYTNQSMINDLYGIYFANRGLAVLDPARATPEPEIRRYLYESIGLQPWLGSETDQGPSRSAGENYLQLTAKGLTKELGYVGTYGEVLDWVNDIYDATRPKPGEPGDEKIKAQLLKMARARAFFRHPALDAEGHRAMRLETIAGWRDSHYPGDIVYGQRPAWDASSIQTAANTLDPHAVGYAQQMLADHQFFSSLEQQAKGGGQRITTGLLETPGQYELLKAQPPSPHRLPMSWDQPDLVFTDEENGVLAVKRGDEILFASLYWRARYAVNFLARVHFLTPRFDRIAVVRQETEFEESGMTYTRPDWTNFGFGNGGLRYPGQFHSAHAGEKLPIAKIPPGIGFKPGQENVYAGKGDFYTLRYGRYLIGMNCSKEKTFALRVPEGEAGKQAAEMVSRKTITLAEKLDVAPRSTVVLHLPENAGAK